MSKIVRLKPYDKRAGHLKRRYVISLPGGKSMTFDAKRGWYKVPDALARILADVHQKEYDPLSGAAFDICEDEDGAKRLEAAIKKAKERKRKQVEIKHASASAPVDLTFMDLPKSMSDADTESDVPLITQDDIEAALASDDEGETDDGDTPEVDENTDDSPEDDKPRTRRRSRRSTSKA
jgi:hypothetical protein